jgi:hypothetical protein
MNTRFVSIYTNLKGYAVALFEQDRTDSNNKKCKLIDITVGDRPSNKSIHSILVKYLDDGHIRDFVTNRGGSTQKMIEAEMSKCTYVIDDMNPADLAIAINDEILTFSDELKTQSLRKVGSIADEAEIPNNHYVSALLLGVAQNNRIESGFNTDKIGRC